MRHVDVAFDIYLRRADGSGMQSCANIRAPPTNGDIRPNRIENKLLMASKKIEPGLFESDALSWLNMSSLYDRQLRFKHS